MSKTQTAMNGPIAAPQLIALHVAVVLSGASMVMLALLGTRLIGSFYGLGLYVWTSLVAVTLAALAAGHVLGGVAADRMRRYRLSHSICLAAILTLLVPIVREPVLLATDSIGPRGGPLVSVLALLALPLMFLGMVGPQTIRLTTRDSGAVGRSTGTVYATMLVGSAAGTIGLGLFLLPTFRTSVIVYAIGAVLLMLAIAARLAERALLGSGRIVTIAAVTVLVMCGVVVQSSFADDRPGWIIAEKESLFGRVRVVEEASPDITSLYTDASMLATRFVENGEPVLPYVRVVETLPSFVPGGRRALVIGLGGGYLPHSLARQGLEVVTIEVDPNVADLARTYYPDWNDQHRRLIIGDARAATRRIDEQFDIIVHDCFTGGSVPARLLSRETMEELNRLLAPGGVLAINYLGYIPTDDPAGEDASAVLAIHRTIGAVFEHQRQFTSFSQRQRTQLSDVMFFASQRPITMPAAIENRTDHSATVAQLERRVLELDSTASFVITDDYNPLDMLQVRQSEAYRQSVIDRVGPDMLLE